MLMKKNLLIYSVIIFIYAVITLICVFHHEIWSDEAQAWQLCSYLSPFELIKHLHIEGHPPLFYFLVMPFAKLSSNIIFMQLICWLASVVAVVLLFYFSPFNIYIKLSVLFSAGFFYFFPVMARSYSLIPVLVFLTAILYSKSKQHPILYCIILSLIANTHVIMLGFSFMLLLDFIWTNIIKDRNNENIIKYVISALIALASIMFLVFVVHDTLSINKFISFNTDNILSESYKVFVSFFVNSFDKDIYMNNLVRLWEIPFIILIIILNLLLLINLFINSKNFCISVSFCLQSFQCLCNINFLFLGVMRKQREEYTLAREIEPYFVSFVFSYCL